MVPYRHHHAIRRRLNQGRIFRLKPDKDNSQISGFLVKVFHQTVSPDIPVQYKNICLRILLFDDQSIFHRILATYPGAVYIFVISGAHTLDHDHR